jgi:acyl carrier protein
MPDFHPLTFTDFQKQLARILHLDPGRLTGDTNLVTDLGLDSLKMLEMHLEFEKLGISLDLKEALGIQTVAEAYEYYQRKSGALKTDAG